jgi:hypothetical protein
MITIPVNTQWVLTWTITDSSGNPINSANVVATLYSGRSPMNPIATPGTPVPPIVDLPLTYVASSNGQYTSGGIPGTLDPDPQTNFTLVIDASISGQQLYHTEQPVYIETVGSPLDLTTVDLAKGFISGKTPGVPDPDDSLIQSCITSWGTEWLNRTGTGDQSGDFQQSPWNSVCTFTDVYDGAGGNRQFLRNRPIQSVISLTINGLQIAASTGYPAQGYLIDGTRKSISLLGGLLGWNNQLWASWQAGPYHKFRGGLRFWEGTQNVTVNYTAGYNITPADVTECASKVVSVNYKRKTYVDEESRAVGGGGGTTRFRGWDIPLECQGIVDRYTRTL